MLRNLILSVVGPRLAEKMENESRLWFVVCPKCKAQTSIWDLGGLRYKGSGKPSTFMRCQTCHERSWHSVEWKG